jgi:putative flippase GtrA
MPERWQRWIAVWHGSWVATTLRGNEFLRFLVAAGINTLFGFTVYGLGIISGAPVWLALLIGMLAGTVFNFFTTGGYAFRQLSVARYPRFVACYFLVYGTNLVLFEVLSGWISNKLIIQALLSIPLALLSYVLLSRLVFAKNA